MKHKMKRQTVLIFALASIVGLLVNSLNYMKVIDLGPYVGGTVAVLIGIALFIEGSGFTIFKYLKGGLTKVEIVHIITAMLGIVVMAGGIAELLGAVIVGTPLGGIVAFANGIAILFVVIQSFVV